MAPNSATHLDRFFHDYPAINFFRLQWIDYSGVLRVRIVTKERCEKIATGEDRCSLAQNCMIIPISTAPRCWPIGIEEWYLLPDWESLMPCGFNPAHASVMCHTAILGAPDPLERCPRAALRRALQAFTDTQQGAKLLMGFEIEYVLLDQSCQLACSRDQTVGYSMMAGMRGENLALIEDIVASLSASSIKIHHFHVELADQYEIALSPLAPMQAIDSLVMALETIKTVALRHGRTATMTPKPVLSGPRSGCHVHFSINPSPFNASSFLAGVMDKLAALCAFGLANYDSYCRVAGDCAGEWVGWGTGNKDLPVRSVAENRWEFRFLDTTANVYLFTAALISAGTAGVRNKAALSFGDCQVVPSALNLDEAERQLLVFGITQRMPASLRAALDLAGSDRMIGGWVGHSLLNQYLDVKEKEVEHFAQMTEEHRRRKYLDYF